jgi:hypothetical protein
VHQNENLKCIGRKTPEQSYDMLLPRRIKMFSRQIYMAIHSYLNIIYIEWGHDSSGRTPV